MRKREQRLVCVVQRFSPDSPALKGGDWTSLRLSLIADVDVWAPSAKPLISPLEGEMPGRAERGASR
ncbi:MAG: lytic murein transglycosylase [Mesorhizobium sp.]|nr:MAG: lytic murein transglycosylase [Mesorhizobium sp.]RWE00507.1 MAG: lytic murein transglycosylase [Mesorhizobium sp.]TIS50645.1 MAG: lytic murein transglycosylase [Mesorhizobium sp.]TIT96399.1 MAG: lytic murein transglycosylase [Mesorhizobium sp.]